MRGTLLGFDFGVRRIGVAVGETGTRIASPLRTIEAEANEPRLRAIGLLVDEWHPVGFVVGRPRHADGSPHETARLAERFGRRLASRYSLPVVFVDETLSSAAAESALRESRAGRAKAGDVDAVAAALILQAFLDDPGR